MGKAEAIPHSGYVWIFLARLHNEMPFRNKSLWSRQFVLELFRLFKTVL